MGSTGWYFLGGLVLGVCSVPVLILIALRLLVRRLQNRSASLQPPPLPSSEIPPADYSLALQTLDGATTSLEELRGKTVVLNFWATWCPGCVMELPNLAQLAQWQDVHLLCITDEPADTVRAFLAKKPELQIPIYLRSSGPLSAPYESQGIPNTCILSPQGSVVFSHCGAADWGHASVKAYLQKLSGGDPQSQIQEPLVECENGACPLPTSETCTGATISYRSS